MTIARIVFVFFVLDLVLLTSAGWSYNGPWKRNPWRRSGCNAVNCEWNNWEKWGECDRHCGPYGVERRVRTVRRSASCGGHGCDGDPMETRVCNRICYNGGSMRGGMCDCTVQYGGTCCQIVVWCAVRRTVRGRAGASGTGVTTHAAVPGSNTDTA